MTTFSLLYNIIVGDFLIFFRIKKERLNFTAKTFVAKKRHHKYSLLTAEKNEISILICSSFACVLLIQREEKRSDTKALGRRRILSLLWLKYSKASRRATKLPMLSLRSSPSFTVYPTVHLSITISPARPVGLGRPLR